MVTPAETAVATETPVATETSSLLAKDSLVAKVEKHVEAYRAKIQKLQEENQRLKAALSQVRNVNSRVRRIPKKAAAATEEVVSA